MNKNNDDFIEESISERIWGLTEMFPEPLIDFTVDAVNTIKSASCSLLSNSKSLIWVATSAMIIIGFPVVIGIETIRIEETNNQQQKQVIKNKLKINNKDVNEFSIISKSTRIIRSITNYKLIKINYLLIKINFLFYFEMKIIIRHRFFIK